MSDDKARAGRILKDLLAEKPLDKITVTDLTEHCGVNRMTFLPTKDIYDLVRWAYIESATRALAGQDLRRTVTGLFADPGRAEGPVSLSPKVYHSISREHIENYLYRLTYDLMISVVEKNAGTGVPRDKGVHREFSSTPSSA